MPKRTPSGRMKKSARDRRPSPRPVEAAEATASAAPATTAPTTPSRLLGNPTRAAAGQPSRQSVLSSVRRPARQSGPTLITDYAYVLSDLRRIGILAVVAVAILVGLTFVIR